MDAEKINFAAKFSQAGGFQLQFDNFQTQKILSSNFQTAQNSGGQLTLP